MRLKARSSHLTFAFSCRLQATSSESRLALLSAACVLTAPSSSRVLEVAATGTAGDSKVRQLRPARARNTPPAHKQQQEGLPTTSVSRTTRVQLLATSAAMRLHCPRRVPLAASGHKTSPPCSPAQVERRSPRSTQQQFAANSLTVAAAQFQGQCCAGAAVGGTLSPISPAVHRSASFDASQDIMEASSIQHPASAFFLSVGSV